MGRGREFEIDCQWFDTFRHISEIAWQIEGTHPSLQLLTTEDGVCEMSARIDSHRCLLTEEPCICIHMHIHVLVKKHTDVMIVPVHTAEYISALIAAAANHENCALNDVRLWYRPARHRRAYELSAPEWVGTTLFDHGLYNGAVIDRFTLPPAVITID